MTALHWTGASTRWPSLPEQAKRCRCAFFIAVVRGACEVDGLGTGVRRHDRAGYVGAGLSAVAMIRKTAASGQAEAKATRMRVAVSMTRAATLSNRRRSVANSAVASAAAFGISCWMRHISQQRIGRGCGRDKAGRLRFGNRTICCSVDRVCCNSICCFEFNRTPISTSPDPECQPLNLWIG